MPKAAAALATPRRPTNVTLSEPLLTEARALGINLSQACERGLAAAVAEAKAQQWLAEIRPAIEAWNEYVDRHRCSARRCAALLMSSNASPRPPVRKIWIRARRAVVTPDPGQRECPVQVNDASQRRCKAAFAQVPSVRRPTDAAWCRDRLRPCGLGRN